MKVHVMDLITVIENLVLTGSDQEELASCFAMGVALLGLQTDFLKSVSVSGCSAQELQQQLEALRDAALQLWAAAVKCQIILWMELAAYNSRDGGGMLVETEHELQKTFLYAVLTTVMLDTQAGHVNSLLLLSSSPSRYGVEPEEGFAALENVLPVTAEDVLRSLPEACLVDSRGQSCEQRVCTLVKQCVDAAMHHPVTTPPSLFSP